MGIPVLILDFNPRPRVGGDPACEQEAQEVFISIHAPAWGATLGWKDGNIYILFQSTPPRGGRLKLREKYSAEELFQSTPPRGGRPDRFLKMMSWFYFNPRPRVGGDNDVPIEFFISIISIHAPAWGATWTRRSRPHTPKFQSTPPRGGRRGRGVHGHTLRNFNPRPRVGGDAPMPFLLLL